MSNNYFSFPLNKSQKIVFNSLREFTNQPNKKVFILKGYAGTGKTTIIAGLIKWLKSEKINFSLLASTGRAAKILSDKSNVNASTVHRRIYVFNDLEDDIEEIEKTQNSISVDDKGQLSLLFELVKVNNDFEKVYIIDESSMISDNDNQNSSFAKFGSGKLLSDLFEYDKKGKFIFVGDPLQLPPIGQKISPALSKLYLETEFSFNVDEFELKEIMRQDSNSGIIKASMNLRKLYSSKHFSKWSYFPIKGTNEIKLHNSHADLINHYLQLLTKYGVENSSILCTSNKQCADLNKIVRLYLNRNENILNQNDLLMVTQNNYLTGLVNGDLVRVLDIGSSEKRCGLTFRKVEVEELVSKSKYNVNIIEDILTSNRTNLDNKEHKELFIDFFNRMKGNGIKQKDEKFKSEMLTDPYLNALKSVYGYALTCHKSQGGEWDNIYLYLDNKIQGKPKPEVYQWMYTAVTRAKKKLHIVDDWFIKNINV